MKIGLCFFTIKVVEVTKVSLSLSKYSVATQFVMPPTMSIALNEWCYTAISNGCLTLDKCCSFKALDNFDVNDY